MVDVSSRVVKLYTENKCRDNYALNPQMMLSVSVFRMMSHNFIKREMLRDCVQDMPPSMTTVIIRECASTCMSAGDTVHQSCLSLVVYSSHAKCPTL